MDASILGSGSIVARAATADILDELQVMLVPVTLGGGKRLFDGPPPRDQLAARRRAPVQQWQCVHLLPAGLTLRCPACFRDDGVEEVAEARDF